MRSRSNSSGTTTSTTAGIFNGTADHNQYRYRVGTIGYYADTNVVDLLAVHELELNGPDGTFLNGSLLNADLKNVAEASPLTWGVFARHATDGSAERYQCAKVRMWYFKLWADGTLVRDLVPVRKRGNGVGLFDRAGGEFYPNVGNSTRRTGSTHVWQGLPAISGCSAARTIAASVAVPIVAKIVFTLWESIGNLLLVVRIPTYLRGKF